jgi:hypothetical protein
MPALFDSGAGPARYGRGIQNRSEYIHVSFGAAVHGRDDSEYPFRTGHA